MEKLPPEVVSDILTRLPVDSIPAAKSVSKLWNSIIKNPSFATTHLARNNKPSLLLHFSDLFLLDPNNPNPSFLPVRTDFLNPDLKLTVVGSTNGILCLTTDEPHSPFYLCNPVLNEYLTIPPNPNWPPVDTFKRITGFACDPSTGDYKLLMVFNSLRETPDEGTEVVLVPQICTVKLDCRVGCEIGSWRSVGAPPFPFCYTTGRFVNGRWHWLSDRVVGPECIVYFDVQDEEFGVMPVPKWDLEYRMDRMLVRVLGGRLCLIRPSFGKPLDVWVMKDYGRSESWVKEYNIKTGALSFTRQMQSYYPLCLLDNEEMLLCNVFGDFLSYDPDKDVLREFRVLENDDKGKGALGSRRSLHHSLQHTCSFMSLKIVKPR